MKRESVARANLRLRRELGRLHGMLDEQHAKPHDTGLAPSCARGCNACCRQIVVAEYAEAEYIVARNPEAIRRALPKLREHAAILRAAPSELADSDHGAREYWRLNLPCALLDERGECSVYADRPIACRTWFVADDPARCASEEPQSVRVLDYGTRHAGPDALLRLVAGARRPIPGGGLPVMWGALPQLLMHVIDGRGPADDGDGVRDRGRIDLKPSA